MCDTPAPTLEHNTTTVLPPASLLGLPRELRLLIYDEVLNLDTDINIRHYSGIHLSQAWQTTPIVLLGSTCSLVAKEARAHVRSLHTHNRAATIVMYDDSRGDHIRLRRLPCPINDCRLLRVEIHIAPSCCALLRQLRGTPINGSFTFGFADRVRGELRTLINDDPSAWDTTIGIGNATKLQDVELCVRAPWPRCCSSHGKQDRRKELAKQVANFFQHWGEDFYGKNYHGKAVEPRPWVIKGKTVHVRLMESQCEEEGHAMTYLYPAPTPNIVQVVRRG